MIGGLLTSFLTLTLLQAVVSSAGATGRVGSLLSGAGTVVEHLASPNVPAIPDLRGSIGVPGTRVSTVPSVLKKVPAPSPTPRLPTPTNPNNQTGIF